MTMEELVDMMALTAVSDAARELEGHKKALHLMNKGFESTCELMDDLKQENRRLKAEVARLKKGDFTEEEFQNLCHNLPEDCPVKFAKGCTSYNRKLFGDRSKL